MVAVVFGAAGSVGSHVAAGLAARDIRVRATSRRPESGRLPAGTEVVAADLERPETLPAALAGAETVFLYAKPEGIDGFVAAAEAAGVRHVALLSSGGVVSPRAEENPIARLHRAVEVALEGSGLAWTFIRGGMFATNARWWWTDPIRNGDAVRLPYPEAQTAPVHEKDLAAIAVSALTEPGHAGQAYLVNGPESLTLREQVGHIGRAIGREIAIEAVPEDEARADLARTMPPAAVDAIMYVWKAGVDAPAPVSTTVRDVTGQPPHSFAEWAGDHADDFR
ncbi:NAD(P)H-binding protein [Rugosimonospora africana]|uniref:Nucleotide-diphosphate-sugar epimerase n=1 Tax=Rugosimonospora africana TaxID=556532 RepID=A0A8J3R2Z0_9ACTN|nr:NAD(P)H-binding protein [Rugosimonospora africana]GIH20723.1 nucleotide-diphosphate-sugar epimerase [Rugosimonospora africana]